MRPEEKDAADYRAQAVSGWKERRGCCWAARKTWASERGKEGELGHGKETSLARKAGRRREAAQRAEREEVRDLGGSIFSKPFSFKTLFLNSFRTSKFFSNFKHFKPFACFQIILKTFKTSHQHTKTSCIANHDA
jgi:hypothetical protein